MYGSNGERGRGPLRRAGSGRLPGACQWADAARVGAPDAIARDRATAPGCHRTALSGGSPRERNGACHP
ncbi:hypothetical protein DEF23_25945 [Marinitenerispora sediminis]|uniref:Uncharacterized protein n=1 Tax=Marinitenerispora sediminis TaxID=1931232 RepID=A0A368SYI7_9ACTN|nr:hypothetical protein DEF23_25945 [Marinitenerispora sediminis]RCV49225.1 hypothetical protein DEF24_25450 [Marinitenerispora sediminis]RCV50257.1 hypothetical protein DEF28_18510 [Marinitenerispora sediminis]